MSWWNAHRTWMNSSSMCVLPSFFSACDFSYDLNHENGGPLFDVRSASNLNNGLNAYRNVTDGCYITHLYGAKCGPEEDSWANPMNEWINVDHWCCCTLPAYKCIHVRGVYTCVFKAELGEVHMCSWTTQTSIQAGVQCETIYIYDVVSIQHT